MNDDALVSPEGWRVAPSALRWRFSRSGGPGGQHVNTTESKVELRLIVEESGLPDHVAERLGDEIRVIESSSRSQHRNRETALQRLLALVDGAARPQITRRKTRPKRGAVESRLQDKRATASRKAGRSWKPDE
jgi:ribosome-associated protein